MTTSEKVSYLKGLFEGLNVEKDSNQGRLFATIIDVLEDIAFDLDDLSHSTEDLAETVDLLSDDLAELEDNFYSEDEDEDCCHECEDDDSPVFYEVTCPACNETITIDEDVLDLGRISCPNCGELLEFDFSDDSDNGDELINEATTDFD